MPITAENLINGGIWLVEPVRVGDDGEVYIDIYDSLERGSVADGLANRAVQLISESSQQR